MYELSRRVRFSLGPAQLRAEGTGVASAGEETAFDAVDIGPFYELEVTCRGEPDRTTGYLLNISVIDDAVRTHALEPLGRAVAAWIAGRPQCPGSVLATVVGALQPALGGSVSSIRWWLSPYHWIRCEVSHMDRILLARQFEFSAAHRLHCPGLSPEANRAIFGKCNNPSGHGHNYKLQATVSVELDPSATSFGFSQLKRVVEEHVIRRFDHKHLNLDEPAFADLNPSVEHIAKVCHDLLADPIEAGGATLESVTVWETDKTSCTYPVGPF